MNRRTFIRNVMAGAAFGAAGCGTTEEETGAAAVPWGTPPESASNLILSPSARPEGVLEIFLMGGLCPWDTFYVVEEHGRPDGPVATAGTQWWTFQDGSDSVKSVYQGLCGATGDLLVPFGEDSAGLKVNLGPWLYELRSRPDILDRMRVFVMQHPFEPHEVASPLALCGHTRGEIRMASTGAHVQRHLSERLGFRPEPYAYTLFSGDSEIEAQFDINSASASGLHPASSRPLQIRLVEDNAGLGDSLRRARLGSWRKPFDDLVERYIQRYRGKLSIPGTDLHHAARALGDFSAARATLRQGEAVADLLPPWVLEPFSGSACQTNTSMDTTFMGIRMGAYLLTHPQRRAHYVNYIDSGLVNALGAGYDTHDYHVIESSRNVINLTRQLKLFINEPGERHPQKLDLDRHMVLLTSEFGRTPEPENGKPQGLDHWPFGYVMVAIGGPVKERKIVGSIGADAYATEAFSPSEFRSGLLSAMGIWPFSDASFAVGDVRGASTEPQAARWLLERLWGLEVG